MCILQKFEMFQKHFTNPMWDIYAPTQKLTRRRGVAAVTYVEVLPLVCIRFLGFGGKTGIESRIERFVCRKRNRAGHCDGGRSLSRGGYGCLNKRLRRRCVGNRRFGFGSGFRFLFDHLLLTSPLRLFGLTAKLLALPLDGGDAVTDGFGHELVVGFTDEAKNNLKDIDLIYYENKYI